MFKTSLVIVNNNISKTHIHICRIGAGLTTFLLRLDDFVGNSERVSCMFIGLPSSRTSLYCFMAFTASDRLSKTTSAVPNKTELKLLVHTISIKMFDLHQRTTRSTVMYGGVIQWSEISKQFIYIRFGYAIVQIRHKQLR